MDRLFFALGRLSALIAVAASVMLPGVAGAHVMAPMNFAEIPAVIAESAVAGRRVNHAVH